IAVVDADIKDAMMLRAVQTLNATELKAKDMTLSQWYLSVLEKYRTDFSLRVEPPFLGSASKHSNGLLL
ncbi:MAG: hypothetical protein MR333_02935, partial [Porphyromonadaceae bacterium]|nr:hypothetical protein [Porphyromonadaceae bacterium]